MVELQANVACIRNHPATKHVITSTGTEVVYAQIIFAAMSTIACNSTIQLWLTPVRDMAIFFCYVYIIVDSVIQLSGIATIYTAFFSQWEYMQWIMVGLLALMMLMVIILVKPVRGPMFIPLSRVPLT